MPELQGSEILHFLLLTFTLRHSKHSCYCSSLCLHIVAQNWWTGYNIQCF